MDTREVQFVAQELYNKLEIMSENGIAICKKLENDTKLCVDKS